MKNRTATLAWLALLLSTAAGGSGPEIQVDASASAAAAAGSDVSEVATEDRIIVRSHAELPAFSYTLTKPPSELIDDAVAFDSFAAQVGENLATLLAGLDIQDPSALAGVYPTLRNLALLRGDADAALAHSETIRGLQHKPAEKLLSGLQEDAAAVAIRAGEDPGAREAAYREQFERSLASLPWQLVQSEIRQMKMTAELTNANLLLGMIQSNADPVHAKSGEVSQELASVLIQLRTLRELMMPHASVEIAALDAFIRANDAQKPDIWPARKVSLQSRDNLTPVVVVIWDTGVDIDLFPDQLHSNPDEQVNGLDDDANGFIDDRHGIAYDVSFNKTTGLLRPMTGGDLELEATARSHAKGFQDMRIGIDSPEAQAVLARFSSLQPDEVGEFTEQLRLYNHYDHGTHVTGIALDGNPAARLLTIRITFSHQNTPPPYTQESAVAFARHAHEVVEYLKAQDVRVVNMSWAGKLSWIEHSLEANGMGGSPEQRRREAQALAAIEMTALTEAIRAAPEILFVASAGNDDDDVDFALTYPAGIDLPNVLTAGAVDQAGDEAAFTSHGRLVRVHANGYQVESYVPGGTRQQASGTSMAAPQVTNLAAKLFALDPSLTVVEVVELILDGAERSEDGRRNLINPARSVELLAERGR